MNTPPKKTPTNRTAGSVLILTMIISSVLFSIGISLASILEKEVTRHLYADRAVVALNIANTALECTLYNDFRYFAFNENLRDQGLFKFTCGNVYQVRNHGDWSEPYVPQSTTTGDARGTGTYQYDIIQVDKATVLNLDSNTNLDSKTGMPCASVTVKKLCTGGTSGGAVKVCEGSIESSIEVKGYFACSEGNESDRALVQRFQVYY